MDKKMDYTVMNKAGQFAYNPAGYVYMTLDEAHDTAANAAYNTKSEQFIFKKVFSVKTEKPPVIVTEIK